MSDAHLPDDVLLSVADDADDAGGAGGAGGAGASGDAHAHVAACPTCRERVTAYRAAAAALRCASVPARAWCPPREALLGFAPDLGAPPPAPTLRAHVAACPACRDDVRDLVALDAVAPPALEALRARVTLLVEHLGDALGRGLRLLESTLDLAPAPAPALARGPASPRPDAVAVAAPLGAGVLTVTWVVAADGVDLRARASAGAPTAFRLDLSTRAPEPGGADREAERPEAWRLLESRSADDSGEVTLAGLAPGRYLLAVYGPQRGEPDLSVELDLRA